MWNKPHSIKCWLSSKLTSFQYCKHQVIHLSTPFIDYWHTNINNNSALRCIVYTCVLSVYDVIDIQLLLHYNDIENLKAM